MEARNRVVANIGVCVGGLFVVLTLGCTKPEPVHMLALKTIYVTVKYDDPQPGYCTQTSNPVSPNSKYQIDVPNTDYVSWVSADVAQQIIVKFSPGSSPFYSNDSKFGPIGPGGSVQSGQAGEENGASGTPYYYQSLMVGGKACQNVTGANGAQQLGIIMR